MAAEIKPTNSSNSSRRGGTRKPQLLSKLEGHTADITSAVFIPNEDGVISSSDDRTVRIWLKRDTGQYWPSICETLPASASCLFYHHDTRLLFVGLDNGEIHEFHLAEDYNSMQTKRIYLAHRGRVTGLVYSPARQWILSCSRDKYFMNHCTETGQRLCGYQTPAWCTCVQFDEPSKYIFIGDYSGQVTVLKIESRSKLNVITTLKGHTGSVRCLAWDEDKSLLFSASFDHSIIMWDIGGRQGNAYELQGHHDKVQSILYCPLSKQLISGSEDTVLAFWNMDIKRQETPPWSESDLCEKCGVPFFWNMRAMFQMRCVGVRQHHCRRCGMAVCDKCCSGRSTIPLMGYEYDVRVCELCLSQITDLDRSPLATFHESKHAITHLDINVRKKVILTVGKDRIVKLWDVSSVLH